MHAPGWRGLVPAPEIGQHYFHLHPVPRASFELNERARTNASFWIFWKCGFMDKSSKELAQERDSNWKFSTNVVDMDCCSRNEISYVPLKNVFFYIIMRKNIFQLSIHCKIVEKGEPGSRWSYPETNEPRGGNASGSIQRQIESTIGRPWLHGGEEGHEDEWGRSDEVARRCVAKVYITRPP